MKGTVFRKFIDYIEDIYGLGVLDRILDTPQLKNRAYTANGEYDFRELFMIAGRLQQVTGEPESVSFTYLGEIMWYYWLEIDHTRKEDIAHPFDMMIEFKGILTRFIQRSNPDAGLPNFDVLERKDNLLKLHYYSYANYVYLVNGVYKAILDMYDRPGEVLLEEAEQGAVFTIFLQD